MYVKYNIYKIHIILTFLFPYGGQATSTITEKGNPNPEKGGIIVDMNIIYRKTPKVAVALRCI